MKKLVNRAMMQEVDRITIEEYKIPSMVLMERAALKVYEHVKELLEEDHKSTKCKKAEQSVLVVCSVGNNGADGIAVARMLALAGVNVQVKIFGTMSRATKELQQQLEIVTCLGVPFVLEPSYNDYSIIIDAIFGIGLTRDVTGKFADVIRSINESNAIIVAIDLPSGIHADDGAVMGIAVKADITVTFGYQKIGLIRYPGREYAGTVYVEEIGFPSAAYDRMRELHSDWFEPYTFDKEDLVLMPKRPRHSHKGTFGTVLVIAGSKGMSGACYFAAKAALRTGAGLVKVLTVEDNRSVLQTSLPEAVVLTYDEAAMGNTLMRDRYIEAIQSAGVIIVGPGLGKSQLSEDVLKLTLQYTSVPTIIDADGINLLADMITERLHSINDKETDMTVIIKRRLLCLEEIIPENVILTPHLKEFSRLFHCDIDKIYKKFIDTDLLYSYNKVLICIIKDAVTTVVAGKKRYFNTSGNDGLATGGSGDVLTGIIGGMISQGLGVDDAACLGVYVHGLTSENYTKYSYSGSMIASDIMEKIGEVLK